MNVPATFWACFFWFVFVVSQQHYVRLYWKRTDSEHYHWPRAIITSRGFQAALIWPVVLVLIQIMEWEPKDNGEKLGIYLIFFIAGTDLFNAVSEYWVLYTSYLKWHAWFESPPHPDKEAWMFFCFGMDKQEKLDICDHEPDSRFNVIKRVYEDYKQTGNVKIPKYVKPLNDVVAV